ncbi:hypothetical protein EGR_09139 [Echinococcus granulosus]|uniref:Uncharacterized protein n=1 Tax=Echinococcus granulosus TaxID=6210 RepID=W6URK6_ECHGR|nr:hypothetical protein EGR_09139 [Echinococcus granulosus]EUB56014.1 hypothetical protein EGR_09139 [Echinococcus granulosus]
MAVDNTSCFGMNLDMEVVGMRQSLDPLTYLLSNEVGECCSGHAASIINVQAFAQLSSGDSDGNSDLCLSWVSGLLWQRKWMEYDKKKWILEVNADVSIRKSSSRNRAHASAQLLPPFHSLEVYSNERRSFPSKLHLRHSNGFSSPANCKSQTYETRSIKGLSQNIDLKLCIFFQPLVKGKKILKNVKIPHTWACKRFHLLLTNKQSDLKVHFLQTKLNKKGSFWLQNLFCYNILIKSLKKDICNLEICLMPFGDLIAGEKIINTVVLKLPSHLLVSLHFCKTTLAFFGEESEGENDFVVLMPVEFISRRAELATTQFETCLSSWLKRNVFNFLIPVIASDSVLNDIAKSAVFRFLVLCILTTVSSHFFSEPDALNLLSIRCSSPKISLNLMQILCIHIAQNSFHPAFFIPSKFYC